MIYVHMATLLRTKFPGWNVSLGYLEASMSLIVCLAWKLLGFLYQQRIPDVWCFHGKYYFNSRSLTHLMGRMPTGTSCLPTLPHLLRVLCVYVCERERGGERERDRGWTPASFQKLNKIKAAIICLPCARPSILLSFWFHWWQADVTQSNLETPAKGIQITYKKRS